MNCSVGSGHFGDIYSFNRCISYYECNNYVPTLRKCAEGLYYNELTQMCDLKSNVPCVMVPEYSEEEDDEYNDDGNFLLVCATAFILLRSPCHF